MALVLHDYHKFLLLALMSAAVFFACFFVTPHQVRAEELTEEQIDAVLNLLESFNASDTAVKGVEAALRGEGEIKEFKKIKDDESDDDDDVAQDDIKKNDEQINKGRRAAICPRLLKPLWQGMRDNDPASPDVKELQEFLAAHYGLSDEDLATGYFGPLTHWLLVNFQQEEGLPAQGFAGDLTRGKILRYCIHQLDNKGKGNAEDKIKAEAPNCELKASDEKVELGESVTLTWESENATYSSSPGGKDNADGSVQVTPTETTVYKKTVFGPGGEASCTAEVIVDEKEEDVPTQQMVVAPRIKPFSQTASVVLTAASLPFLIATDALTNVFLALGIR